MLMDTFITKLQSKNTIWKLNLREFEEKTVDNYLKPEYGFKMTTEELEKELRRRKTKHNIKVGPMVIALDYDEIVEVMGQIRPILYPGSTSEQIKR
jgi:hypothetical protein